MDMILEKKNGQKAYVRYFTGKSVRSVNIRELIDDLILNDTIKKSDTIIFITMDDSNDSIHEFVKQLWEEENIFVTLLSVRRLQFNILEHEIVPQHIIIDDEEISDIMLKYKLKERSLFPEISRYDPVALSLGMRPGEVCKIDRPSKTSIVATYYRLCVNN